MRFRDFIQRLRHRHRHRHPTSKNNELCQNSQLVKMQTCGRKVESTTMLRLASPIIESEISAYDVGCINNPPGEALQARNSQKPALKWCARMMPSAMISNHGLQPVASIDAFFLTLTSFLLSFSSIHAQKSHALSILISTRTKISSSSLGLCLALSYVAESGHIENPHTLLQNVIITSFQNHVSR